MLVLNLLQLLLLLTDELVETLVVGDVCGHWDDTVCCGVLFLLLPRLLHLKAACSRILLTQVLIVGQLVLSQRQLQVILAHDELVLNAMRRSLHAGAGPCRVPRATLANFRC